MVAGLEEVTSGDIRIGARPMSPEVLSISVPHDPFLSGTLSGDVLLNSAARFDGKAVDHHIRDLRTKLQDHPRRPRFIATASGRG